jgi:hypothetical protein
MTETPENRPRPTPKPRPAATVRPSPKPRVAGSRREREDTQVASSSIAPSTIAPSTISSTTVSSTARPAAEPRSKARASGAVTGTKTSTRGASTAAGAAARSTGTRAAATAAGRRRLPALVLVLALLCLMAAAGAGVLVWQRLNPGYVDASIFSAARSGVQALYAYDYRDSEGSVQGKLDVLTGDLREQYEEDLSQGGIIDTYEQVSATTSYEVLDVGLQQVNEAQDTATVVVFGQYVVESVNSGEQPAPEGSECQVTPEGAQSCTQTVQVRVVQVDGEWKISELTLLTTS